MPNVKCSLIISTYNWPEALELCLKSVLSQTHMPDEVIIADDGSGTATENLITSFKSLFKQPLTRVWHDDSGFRKTLILNKAIKRATGDYIIEVDGDVILDRNFIADHLNAAEPKTFIRGTRAMLTEQKTKELFNNKKINLHWFSGGVKHRNNALRISFARFLGTRKAMSSNSVRGSNLSFWKSDYIAVNGYNNDITGWGHEDEELAARFINAGVIKKIVKLQAVQYHLYHKILSRDSEPWQRGYVDDIKLSKVQTCPNGYNETVV